jgi:hypothetical protein
LNRKIFLNNVKSAWGARRVCSRNTKGGIYEIAVFTMVTDDFRFTRDGEDFRNKVPVGELEICIALRIA